MMKSVDICQSYKNVWHVFLTHDIIDNLTCYLNDHFQSS